ncbi:MAG: winged helix-turn-helix domain-containing protein [Thermoplasmata archaeon]
MKILKLVSKTGCAQIILALDKKKLTFGAIAKIVGHPAVATQRLKELKNAGLIDRKVLQDEHRSVEYGLNDNGHVVAKALETLSNVKIEE